MNGQQEVEALIEKIAQDLEIPYIEVHVGKEGKEIFSHCHKPQQEKEKNLLYLYSCTKPMTVVGAMRLVEQGKLNLTDRLVDYIPAYRNSFYTDESGEKHTVGEEITIEHLLSMGAGAGYGINKPELQALHANGQQPTTAQIVETFAQVPLITKPGQRFIYSACHDILGRVVELASGMSFGEYMRQNIFHPLGMYDTGFCEKEKEKERFLSFYEAKEKKIYPIPISNTLVKSSRFESGGAGVISTMEDYAKFAYALANDGAAENGYVLLKKETIQAISQTKWDGRDPKSAFACAQGGGYSYGLGVRVRYEDTPWGLQKGEFGWDGAAGSYLMIDPNRKVGVAMGLHILNWPEVFAKKHLEIVEKIYKTIL